MPAVLTEMETPQTRALQAQAPTIENQARALQVLDQETLDQAGELLKTIKGLREEVENTFGPIVSKAFEAHKEAVKQRKKVDEPLAAAEAALKTSIGRYIQQQNERRMAEERRLVEEAAKRQAEEFEAQLEAMERQGAHKEEVAAAIAQQEFAPMPAIAPYPARVATPSGVSTRAVYSATVDDFRSFAEWVVKQPNLLHLLAPNQTALNQLVRSAKGAMKIPGVRITSSTGVSARRY